MINFAKGNNIYLSFFDPLSKNINVLSRWLTPFYLVWPQEGCLKFIFSEKATNFCKTPTVDLSYVVKVKSKVEILKFFLAFSEFMNFIYLTFPGVAPLLNMIKPVGSLVLNLNDRAPPRLLFQEGNTFEKQIQY